MASGRGCLLYQTSIWTSACGGDIGGQCEKIGMVVIRERFQLDFSMYIVGGIQQRVCAGSLGSASEMRLRATTRRGPLLGGRAWWFWP